MQIGPHPHIGLQTVTWLLDGEVVHRDSLGSEQSIRPGQLNVMTAGNGVAHAEETPRSTAASLHAVQLWVAQPEATRHGPPAFEHHAELPQVELGTATATVIVGAVETPGRRRAPTASSSASISSCGLARTRRPAAGRASSTPSSCSSGPLRVDGAVVDSGQLAYLGSGRGELAITTSESARALLVGGAPFESTPLMWWNFVARDRDEISAAYADWQGDHERFGRVVSGLDAIPAPPPPWLTSPSPFRTRDGIVQIGVVLRCERPSASEGRPQRPAWPGNALNGSASPRRLAVPTQRLLALAVWSTIGSG